MLYTNVSTDTLLPVSTVAYTNYTVAYMAACDSVRI